MLQFLVLDPESRLGATEDSFNQLKNHSWFNGIPWEELERKKASVPPELVKRLAQARKKLPLGEAVILPGQESKNADKAKGVKWYENW